MENNIKTLIHQVEHILKEHPKARDSDIFLMIELWREYHPLMITRCDNSPTEYVSLGKLYQLPREDHISRCRRKVQNDKGLYLPSSWEIAKKRRINEEIWHNYMKN